MSRAGSSLAALGIVTDDREMERGEADAASMLVRVVLISSMLTALACHGSVLGHRPRVVGVMSASPSSVRSMGIMAVDAP